MRNYNTLCYIKLLNLIYHFSDMTGPSLGGFLLQHFGFSICMTTMGMFCLLVVSIKRKL